MDGEFKINLFFCKNGEDIEKVLATYLFSTIKKDNLISNIWIRN